MYLSFSLYQEIYAICENSSIINLSPHTALEKRNMTPPVLSSCTSTSPTDIYTSLQTSVGENNRLTIIVSFIDGFRVIIWSKRWTQTDISDWLQETQHDITEMHVVHIQYRLYHWYIVRHQFSRIMIPLNVANWRCGHRLNELELAIIHHG